MNDFGNSSGGLFFGSVQLLVVSLKSCRIVRGGKWFIDWVIEIFHAEGSVSSEYTNLREDRKEGRLPLLESLIDTLFVYSTGVHAGNAIVLCQCTTLPLGNNNRERERMLARGCLRLGVLCNEQRAASILCGRVAT